MSTRLQDEIKQSRPFRSTEEEALLSIERTAAVLGKDFADAIGPFGLTPTQYNVLRILRGAGEGGLCRYEVGERLVSPVPDVTRLLDRLVAAGLVTRARGCDDRRQVKSQITADGLRLLAELDPVVGEFHRMRLSHVSAESLRTLVEVLGVLRERG